jgi:hypothetical protein
VHVSTYEVSQTSIDPSRQFAGRGSSSASSLVFTAVQSPLMFAFMKSSSVVGAQADSRNGTSRRKVRIVLSRRSVAIASLTKIRCSLGSFGCTQSVQVLVFLDGSLMFLGHAIARLYNFEDSETDAFDDIAHSDYYAHVRHLAGIC